MFGKLIELNLYTFIDSGDNGRIGSQEQTQKRVSCYRSVVPSCGDKSGTSYYHLVTRLVTILFPIQRSALISPEQFLETNSHLQRQYK